MKYAVSMKDEIILERDGIQVGTLEIAIDRSTVWDPVFSWECFQSHALKPDALRVLSEKNQAALSNCRDLSFSDDPSTAGGYSAVPFTRLMNRARQFCTSIKFGERDEAQYWFDQLCGLGIGLTPQGDDLLTGCLYACWATGAVEVDNDWISSISRSAQSKTTTLSAAWLKAASEGACSGMWHQLLQAICAANLREISLSIDPILAQGFTSGLSTLLGFEVGMGVFSGRI
jgi:hypothetical protein